MVMLMYLLRGLRYWEKSSLIIDAKRKFDVLSRFQAVISFSMSDECSIPAIGFDIEIHGCLLAAGVLLVSRLSSYSLGMDLLIN